ncbi:MAG TPA: LysR family transcriptional regulator [Acidimicrobiales bacterium]|nr:LysR family transcriptional regulator [Acidimicrobiales bacterium]
MFDLRRLKVVKAIVDTGSVSAAAAQLSYTPSAVSQQMRALEKETGTVLLEAAGRGVRPTPAALLLAEHAGRVLAAVQQAEEALAALRAGQMGRVRVAAFPTAGSALVPEALAVFEQNLPNVALDLVVAETDQSLANLRSGTIDVAIVVEPFGRGHAPEDGLYRRHLLADPFRVVLPRNHVLARKRAVDLVSLAKERWIGVSSCPGSCQQVVSDACRRAGFDPAYNLEADEYPTAQGFVAAGLGVALVPLLALGAAAHAGVAVRRVSGDQPVRDVWAVTRPAIAKQLPVHEMLADLEQAAARFLAAQA